MYPIWPDGIDQCRFVLPNVVITSGLSRDLVKRGRDPEGQNRRLQSLEVYLILDIALHSFLMSFWMRGAHIVF